MKIIRSGEPNRHQSIKRFDCEKCGCVFEADGGEYQRVDDCYVGNLGFVYCVCPCCGGRVFAVDKTIGEVINSHDVEVINGD